MRVWPLFGITRLLTERRDLAPRPATVQLDRLFRRSLHLYPIDAGNSNALNMEIAALKQAQYNLHRFGIFFADTPRHADLILLLGEPLRSLEEALARTLEQLPRPFGLLWLRERPRDSTAGSAADGIEIRALVERAGGTIVATIDGPAGPDEIIGALRAAMGRGSGR
jgi:Ni,Fe-hydrogenase III small subunit